MNIRKKTSDRSSFCNWVGAMCGVAAVAAGTSGCAIADGTQSADRTCSRWISANSIHHCTRAVGWAIDPKLRNRANWTNKKSLGQQLDQALINLQGKVSQGIPIGDISFLLAEAVLASIDGARNFPRSDPAGDLTTITCPLILETKQSGASLDSTRAPQISPTNQSA